MNWKYSTAFYVYFTFVGISYLLGFWIPLQFNVLEFVSIVDIIKSATYPMIPAAASMFVFVLIDAFNSQGVEKASDDEPKVIKGLIWGFAILMLILAVFNIILLINLIYYFWISEPEKKISFAFPFLSIIAIVYFLCKPPFLKGGNKFIRNFLIIFSCILPSVAFFQGSKNINALLKNEKDFYYLKSSTTNCKVNNFSKYIYLSYYGDRYFFVNAIDKSICIEDEGGVLLKLYKPRLYDEQ